MDVLFCIIIFIILAPVSVEEERRQWTPFQEVRKRKCLLFFARKPGKEAEADEAKEDEEQKDDWYSQCHGGGGGGLC